MTPGVAAKSAVSFNPGVAGYATPGVEGVEVKKDPEC